MIVTNIVAPADKPLRAIVVKSEFGDVFVFCPSGRITPEKAEQVAEIREAMERMAARKKPLPTPQTDREWEEQAGRFVVIENAPKIISRHGSESAAHRAAKRIGAVVRDEGRGYVCPDRHAETEARQ